MSPNRGDLRERELADSRELQELLTAWRAGKWVVRVILVIGTLVTTMLAAYWSLRNAAGLSPHP